MQPAPFARLWLATFVGYLALGVTLQSLPDYLAARFNAGPLAIGTLIGVASVAAAMMRPVAGRAADRGAARRVVMTGSALGVVGGLGHLLAPSLGWLLLARLCLGAGEGSVFTGAVAWILRFAPAERRGRAAGWFGLSMWAGIAVGPLAAVALARAGGMAAVWSAVTLLPALGLLLVATARSPEAIARDIRIPGVLFPAGARVPALAFGLASAGYGSIATLLLLRLADARLGGHEVALALFALLFLCARGVGSPLVDRFGGRRVAMAFGVVEILGLLLVAAGTSTGAVLSGVALVAVGISLMYPSTVEIVVGRTAPEQHGAGIGALTACWDLGILGAGIAGGVIVDLAGYPAAFAASAGLGALAVLLLAMLEGEGQGRSTMRSLLPESTRE